MKSPNPKRWDGKFSRCPSNSKRKGRLHYGKNENVQILKEREGFNLGHFENIVILKEREDFNLGHFENIVILKEREDFNLGHFENIVILKEREDFNLGDGKYSGFPKFEMMASLGN